MPTYVYPRKKNRAFQKTQIQRVSKYLQKYEYYIDWIKLTKKTKWYKILIAHFKKRIVKTIC